MEPESMTWQRDDPELYEKEKAEVEAHFPALRFVLNVDPGSFLGFQPKPEAGVTEPALTSISVHCKTDQTPQPATVQALAQMMFLALKMQPATNIEK